MNPVVENDIRAKVYLHMDAIIIKKLNRGGTVSF